jgi:hypothetical protein
MSRQTFDASVFLDVEGRKILRYLTSANLLIISAVVLLAVLLGFEIWGNNKTSKLEQRIELLEHRLSQCSCANPVQEEESVAVVGKTTTTTPEPTGAGRRGAATTPSR